MFAAGEKRMKYDPDIHHRKSIRLKGYDYSSDGMYFVTICTQDRSMLFGEVVGADSISARLVLNDAGKMMETLYQDTMHQFHDVSSVKHIIMPNHFHGIIAIARTDDAIVRADIESAPTTLPAVIQSFKRNTTIKYINAVKEGRLSPFNKRIWQRNYFERIIRDEDEYLRIWQYIDENPVRWKEDCYYTE